MLASTYKCRALDHTTPCADHPAPFCQNSCEPFLHFHFRSPTSIRTHTPPSLIFVAVLHLHLCPPPTHTPPAFMLTSRLHSHQCSPSICAGLLLALHLHLHQPPTYICAHLLPSLHLLLACTCTHSIFNPAIPTLPLHFEYPIHPGVSLPRQSALCVVQ